MTKMNKNIPIAASCFDFDEYTSIIKELNNRCFEEMYNNKNDIKRFFELKQLVDELQVKQRKYRYIHADSAARRGAIDRLEKWAKVNGVENDGVKVAEFPREGFGLMATKDLEKDKCFLKVPRILMMTTLTALKSDIKAIVAHDPMLNIQVILMAFHLLDEKLKSKSFWKPYLDTLPVVYYNLLHYSEQDFRLLVGSPNFSDCMNTYRYMVRQYTYIFDVFSKKRHMVDKFPFLNLTIEDFCWAVTTVYTRQNEINEAGAEPVIALIPYWDMCNHSCSSPDPANPQSNEITTFWIPASELSDCFTIRNYKKGEQVFIYYGSRSNYELMMNCGFVAPLNSCDNAPLTLGISGADPLSKLKMQLLEFSMPDIISSKKKSATFKLYNDCSSLQKNLILFLRIFSMSKEMLVKYLKLANDANIQMCDLFDVVTPITAENLDYKAWSFLLARLDLLITYSDRQPFMEFTRVLDDELTYTANLSECGIVAVKYRLSVRNVLLNTRNKCLCNLSLQKNSI